MKAALRPRQSVESQNAWNLYGDIAWFGVLAGVVSAFLGVFTIRLGGSDALVGLLSALPALFTMFASIPGGRIVERQPSPLVILLITGALNRIGYLPIALVPGVLATGRAEAVVAIAALLAIPGGIANIAFTTMFARAVRPENRAHVVSVRNILLGVTSTAAAVVGGKLLDWIVFPINYQVLFTGAFAASMLSILYLSRIRLPKDRPARRTGTENVTVDVRGMLSMLSAGDSYTRFTWSTFVFQWGLFFTAPLYSIFWVRTLHASDGWVGLFSMVGSAVTVFFYPFWGRLTAREGNRRAMIATTAGLAAYPIMLALVPSIEWVLGVSFWGGIFSSGQALVFFNGLLEVCPEKHRATRIAIYNTLTNAAAFASPLISTALVDIFGIQSVLILGGGLRLLGSFLIWQQRVLMNREKHAL